MLNKKKMAGRVPLENVSEEKKQNGRTRFGRRLRIFEITRLVKKNGPPRRKITLKINKWTLLKATACNKMKTTTYPYHVVLVPKQKQKANERGINYPGE
jgi:Spy/CpxP family protein refolding chaperone